MGRADGWISWNLQYLNGSQKRDKKTIFRPQNISNGWPVRSSATHSRVRLRSRCVAWKCGSWSQENVDRLLENLRLCQEEPAGPMILASRSSLTQGTRIQWWEIIWAVFPREVRSYYTIMAEKVPWASSSRCESSFYFVSADLSLDYLLNCFFPYFFHRASTSTMPSVQIVCPWIPAGTIPWSRIFLRFSFSVRQRVYSSLFDSPDSVCDFGTLTQPLFPNRLEKPSECRLEE